jgi:hypothetical protein
MFDTYQIAQALSAVLEINEDETERVAFFGFAGHTKSIQIDIYPKGFNADPDWYFVFSQYGTTGESDCVVYHNGVKVSRSEYRTFEQLLDAVRKAGI